MSSLQLIESTLKRTSRRIRLERMWHGLWRGLLVGGGVWLIVFAVYKLTPIPVVSLYVAASVGLLIPIVWAIVCGCRRMSLLETARFVDARKELKERLSTALEISGAAIDTSWKDLVIAD